VARHPRREGKVVEVANFPSRFEADAALGVLTANGIPAMAKYGDAEGWAPNLALLDGFRVCVFEEDLESARDLLGADRSAPLPSDN
jgi:Putative prokaryotic signal transducing protein